MKKTCMILCFFAILLLPNLLGLFLGYEADAANTENRQLAAKPELSLDNLDALPGQTEDYINDHAPFRNLFIDIYASFNMELFHSIDHKEVIVGKDKWLFYTGNESRIDALGVCPFTEADHQLILDLLLRVRDKYTTQNENFVLMIAPNKEIVYSQYMPDYYAPLSDTSKARELVQYIREHSDIQVIYPLEELREASKEHLTYYKTDTHWNDLGGFIGVQSLLQTLSEPSSYYQDIKVTYSPGEKGDLGNLGHTPMRYLEEQSAQVTGFYDQIAVQVLENDDGNTGLIRAMAPDAPDQRSLTMVRDSFAISMAPVLMRYFKDTTFVNWKMLSDINLEDHQSDVFVYEIVERNLGSIPGNLKVMLGEE